MSAVVDYLTILNASETAGEAAPSSANRAPVMHIARGRKGKRLTQKKRGCFTWGATQRGISGERAGKTGSVQPRATKPNEVSPMAKKKGGGGKKRASSAVRRKKLS